MSALTASSESSYPFDEFESIEWELSRTEAHIPNQDFDEVRHRQSDWNAEVSMKNPSGVIIKRRRNHRWIAVLVGMAILIGCALGMYFFLHAKEISLTKRTQAKATTNTSNSGINSEISLEDLKAHNDPTSDCWVAMHDTVFDVTEYALEHPGGPQIIWDFCGFNATWAYAIVHPITYLKDLPSETIMGVLPPSSGSGRSNSTSSQSTTNGDV